MRVRRRCCLGSVSSWLHLSDISCLAGWAVGEGRLEGRLADCLVSALGVSPWWWLSPAQDLTRGTLPGPASHLSAGLSRGLHGSAYAGLRGVQPIRHRRGPRDWQLPQRVGVRRRAAAEVVEVCSHAGACSETGSSIVSIVSRGGQGRCRYAVWHAMGSQFNISETTSNKAGRWKWR